MTRRDQALDILPPPRRRQTGAHGSTHWPATAMALLLAACGGGGGGGVGGGIGSDPTPPLPEPTPVTRTLASGPTLVAPGCDGGRSGGTVFVDAEVEPFVAVSPLNPDLLVGTWQQDRASNGGARALATAVSVDGGRSWSAPVAVNRNPDVAAYTPTLHLRADGTVGLMHYDLRSNTADRDTLLADLWLLSSRDGTAWSETALERGFHLQRAPAATGGLFLGDYHGLVSSRGTFIALAGLPGPDSSNRSEVVALRAPGPGVALHLARPARARALSVDRQGALDLAASEATARWMDARLAGWTARVQRLRPP